MDTNCQQCGRAIEVIPGHRPRLYCNDECKQTAYRRRHGIQERPPTRDKTFEAVVYLGSKYRQIGTETRLLLIHIYRMYGMELATKIGDSIEREVARALLNRNGGAAPPVAQDD